MLKVFNYLPLKLLWYYFIKALIKSSLFFYSKRINVLGKENIPKKGAVLFMVNHPNGLIDPLIVATNNPRVQHFLVRAAVFKKPLVKKLLGTLNLMPIYRIRDGVQQLSKNQEIFDKCYSILNNQKALMIFPEGSHNRMRTIRPLSKGFTRIVFGALEQNPDLNIQIVPVGLTYQNASVFPSNITLAYGQPILVNDYYTSEKEQQNKQIVTLKNVVSQQLQQLTVHIPNDDNYQKTLSELNTSNVDFTQVSKVNQMIKNQKISSKPKSLHLFAFLKPLIFLNTLFPWIIWKSLEKKVDEIEFVDTFRFAVNTVLVPIFYVIQSYLISLYFGNLNGAIYLVFSLFLVFIYTKTHPTPTE